MDVVTVAILQIGLHQGRLWVQDAKSGASRTVQKQRCRVAPSRVAPSPSWIRGWGRTWVRSDGSQKSKKPGHASAVRGHAVDCPLSCRRWTCEFEFEIVFYHLPKHQQIIFTSRISVRRVQYMLFGHARLRVLSRAASLPPCGQRPGSRRPLINHHHCLSTAVLYTVPSRHLNSKIRLSKALGVARVTNLGL
jgi:hypothetical protein